jgi:putative lipoprotein
MAAKTVFALALVALLSCGREAAISDRDWALVALGEKADPVGMDGKRVTLRLVSATSRANGFGGCNSYSGAYELDGDRLTFGPTISTKMFCASSQQVEDEYFAALGKIASWELADGVLTLHGEKSPALRFRAAAP